MGDYDKALEFQLKGTDIFQRILGDHHPDLATSYSNLSSMYQKMGNYEKAQEFAKKAVDIMETAFPNGHRNLDLMKENLELIKVKLGQG